MLELLDHVVIRANAAFGDGVEVEGVLAGAAKLGIAPEAADQQVVALLALEQVIAAIAEELVVAEPAFDVVETDRRLERRRRRQAR